MSLRLALSGELIDLVTGAVVRHPLTGRPVYPLVSKTGQVFYPLAGAMPDDDPEDDDPEEEDDDPDDKSEISTAKTKKDDEPDKARLSREAAGYRKKLRTAEQELATLRQQAEEREAGERTDLENANLKVKELEDKLSERDERIHEMAIQNAFLTDNSYTWHNPQRALKLADLSEVEIDEDGTVTGLSDALKALAESDPYLVKTEDGGDDDDEDDDRPSQTSQVRGKRKRSKDEIDRAALEAKYRGLRR